MSESHLTTDPRSKQARPSADAASNAPSETTAHGEETARAASDATSTAPPLSLGRGLAGEHGPANRGEESQRPSFWRRIALGRRGQAQSEPGSPARAEVANVASVANVANGSLHSPGQAPDAVNPASAPTAVASSSLSAPGPSIETQIVEPMLQALVSVEAKVERSHSELVGRSDQVEQRLTQLWDIEEQLGGLNELQESVVRVSEHQRRLESVILSQTKTIRWLIGVVCLSLAGAAFVIAALLR